MSQTIKKLNSLPLSMLLPLGCLLSYLGVGMTFFICRLELLSRDGFVVSSLTMVISFSQHWFWTFFQTIGLYVLLKYKIDISQVFPVRQLIFWWCFLNSWLLFFIFFTRFRSKQYKKCQYSWLFKKIHLETHKNKTN